MRKYTKEFKAQICELVLKDGVKHSEIAERYGLNITMVCRWGEQYQKKGNECDTTQLGGGQYAECY